MLCWQVQLRWMLLSLYCKALRAMVWYSRSSNFRSSTDMVLSEESDAYTCKLMSGEPAGSHPQLCCRSICKAKHAVQAWLVAARKLN